MPHSHHSTNSVTLSIRVQPEIRDQLEELADATGRTKSFLAAEAIECYIATHAWQVRSIEKAIKKADNKKTKFVEHRKVTNWLNSWGTEEEQEPPR